MAELLCFGSGSSGNSYAIKCENETLLIELGIAWRNIINELSYDIKKIVGCIVSHKHLDHAVSIPNALKLGISVYSCEDVQSVYPQIKVLQKGLKTRIGSFLVQPLPLKHSVECYGFLVETKNGLRIAFATDCSEFLYKLRNIHCWMIEANYSDDILIDNMVNDTVSRSLSENHLELSQTIQALKVNFCEATNAIVLLHLSQRNADPKKFRKCIQEELGFGNVYIAKKGLVLELKKEEF